MSLVGTIIRNSGIYSKFQQHFVETMLLKFATSSQISVCEARFLGEMARNLTVPGPIIEIGTLFGRSTMAISLNKDTGRKLITVDNYKWNPCGLTYDQHSSLTRGILRECCEKENVDMVTMDKKEFYEKI